MVKQFVDVAAAVAKKTKTQFEVGRDAGVAKRWKDADGDSWRKCDDAEDWRELMQSLDAEDWREWTHCLDAEDWREWTQCLDAD